MSSLAKLLLLLAVVGTRVAMAEPPWTLRNLVLDLNEQDTLVFKLLNEKGQIKNSEIIKILNTRYSLGQQKTIY